MSQQLSAEKPAPEEFGAARPPLESKERPRGRTGHWMLGGGALFVVALAGSWLLGAHQPRPAVVEAEAVERGAAQLGFDSSELAAWDSALLLFVVDLLALCARRRIAVDRDGLPAGVRRLLALSEAVAENDLAASKAKAQRISRDSRYSLKRHRRS